MVSGWVELSCHKSRRSGAGDPSDIPKARLDLLACAERNLVGRTDHRLTMRFF